MNVLRRINECESEYMKCFSEASEQEGLIRYHDELIPDMYYHNYTRLKEIINDSFLICAVESEIHYSRNTGKHFCLIRCPLPVNNAISSRFPYESEVTLSGIYVFDVSQLSSIKGAMNSNVVRVDKEEMLEDLLKLDLEHDEEYLGKDFCTRRVYRRKDIYLSDAGVDSYLCYHNNIAVGSGNLFIYNGVAKIEDLSVSPQHQRKGYGRTLLKKLIETAINNSAEIIYLETDEEGSAKEMYKKCGFYKVNEFTDLLFCF